MFFLCHCQLNVNWLRYEGTYIGGNHLENPRFYQVVQGENRVHVALIFSPSSRRFFFQPYIGESRTPKGGWAGLAKLIVWGGGRERLVGDSTGWGFGMGLAIRHLGWAITPPDGGKFPIWIWFFGGGEKRAEVKSLSVREGVGGGGQLVTRKAQPEPTATRETERKEINMRAGIKLPTDACFANRRTRPHLQFVFGWEYVLPLFAFLILIMLRLYSFHLCLHCQHLHFSASFYSTVCWAGTDFFHFIRHENTYPDAVETALKATYPFSLLCQHQLCPSTV